MMSLATEIKNILAEYKIRPNKFRGQNFLINEKIIEKIIAEADLNSNDVVLEIGPGFGFLTRALAEKVKQVVAVELDNDLFSICQKLCRGHENIKFIQGDILKVDLNEILGSSIHHYKLVANIPYQITGLILRRFFSKSFLPQLAVLMTQKEVAERITRKNNKGSILSNVIEFYGEPKFISKVLPGNFIPSPKVDSAIIKILSRKILPNLIDEKRFFALIKTGFSSPRKFLLNNLIVSGIIGSEEVKQKSAFDLTPSEPISRSIITAENKDERRAVWEKVFEEIKIDKQIRAEDLSLSDWLKIYSKINF
ncbi:MAG: 16S rRNA (adenine(1518)-N(6)/adenine(1519)-N(6))-dimethyltransferase RsmA [Patescibacteria group bacterium]